MDTLSRREFLRLSGLVGAGSIMAACGSPAPVEEIPISAPAAPTTVPAQLDAPAAAPSQYNEAPMLAEMVARGELPPVEERLPQNPFVIEGLDGTGNYGGTWRNSFGGQADGGSFWHKMYRGLINIDHEFRIHPYLAEAWEVSPDGTQYTFHLRKGLRWSDGAPMTAEDFRFYYEDTILNREYTRAHPEQLASVISGERVPAEFTLIDDFGFRYTFALPKGLFHYWSGVILNIPALPAHYFKQFHPDYGDKAQIDAWVASNSSWDSWVQMFSDKNNLLINMERPTHQPWLMQNPWADEFVVCTRNPYFWEVDTAGNQLPYIDKVTFRLRTDAQVNVMWCVNGELDCHARGIGWGDYTTLKENEANGDYKIQLWNQPVVSGAHFNMTTKDARLRELFQERDFRIAVSHAINRDEMRELIMDGYCTNMQYTPPPSSPQHYPKLANAYLEYDPDKANALLDALGYASRDAEGYRLFKDGSGERITIVLLGGVGDYTTMLIDYFKDIGIQIVLRTVERALSIEMHQSNEVQMTAGSMDRALIPMADPQIWIKHTNINDRPWANAWTAWYMDPSNPIAERPPDGHWIWDIWGHWEELQRTVGEEAQTAIFWKILDIWAEELPSVGFYGQFPRPVLVKNGFKGIHEGYGWDCCTTIYEYVIDNGTWYWDEPEKHV